MTEKDDATSTSAGELDQRGRRSQDMSERLLNYRRDEVLRLDEIGRLEKWGTELLAGYVHLRRLDQRAGNVQTVMAEYLRRLERVERRLFHLRQGRLL